jgi:formate hydrogenlyase subunit 4
MNFIKSLRLVLLGVAMAAATLSSVEPASALGGCGANRELAQPLQISPRLCAGLFFAP